MGLIRNILVATISSNFLNELNDVMLAFEPSLAVIACALPAYRSLLPVIRRKRNNNGQNEVAEQNLRPLTPTRRCPQHAVLDHSIAELERPVA